MSNDLNDDLIGRLLVNAPFSFDISEGIEAGDAVTIVDNDTIGLGNDGDPLLGVVTKIPDSPPFEAMVQIKGFMILRIAKDGDCLCHQTLRSVGLASGVSVDGRGRVYSTSGDGTRGFVINVDTDAGTCRLLL